MNLQIEDNISVGESVKMRGRWLAEEQRRRAAEKLRLLKEEESRISKMKAKLDRRKKKEERRKRDRERMERGNKELFTGEESFFDLQPVNSSTQKTVMFNKELTKIRNISPVGTENLIEIVEKIENEGTMHEQNCSEHLAFHQSISEAVSSKPESKKVIVKKKCLPIITESQQVFLPTQPLPKSRRKIKRSSTVGSSDRDFLFNPLSVKGFDTKKGVESLLFSNQFNPCEFSLPKEFTSLKLEKIRENKVLNSSFDFSSENLLLKSVKRKREPSENEEHSSPKRRVKSSHREQKCSPIVHKELITKKSDEVFEQVLYDKCSGGELSVIVGISATKMNVWVRYSSGESNWVKVGHFSLGRKLVNPFVMVDRDSIRIKAFSFENNLIKETSFVILGENGDFSDSVTSTQNVLVLTETLNIGSIVVEKFDSKQVLVFHNLDTFTRGSIVTYNQDQLELKFLLTVQGSTHAVKRLKGTEDIFLSFLKNVLFFWNIKSGTCVRTIKMDKVAMDLFRIFEVVNVFGHLNVLYFIEDKLNISVVKKDGLQVLASYPLSLPSLQTSDKTSSSWFHMSEDRMCLLLGSLWLSWNLSDTVISCHKITNHQDFDKFLDFH